ncbi:LysM domain-containing protein [bacterium]|nr:LysM domain-containing protein [bacterium]
MRGDYMTGLQQMVRLICRNRIQRVGIDHHRAMVLRRHAQDDLLLPPHVVAAGETLETIAVPLGVSWQLLAKINGVADPRQLLPGERLKLVRGPFDAVVSVSRRRLSLQLHGTYAGSFHVVVGRQYLERVGGSIPVAAINRVDPNALPGGPATARPTIALTDGLMIEAADDPAAVTDASPASSLVVSPRDLAELVDILGPGSRILVRQ